MLNSEESSPDSLTNCVWSNVIAVADVVLGSDDPVLRGDSQRAIAIRNLEMNFIFGTPCKD
jgi:hypothetical protein